jgi:hypothetical protein
VIPGMAFKRSGVRLPLAPPLKPLKTFPKFFQPKLNGIIYLPREAPGKHGLKHAGRCDRKTGNNQPSLRKPLKGALSLSIAILIVLQFPEVDYVLPIARPDEAPHPGLDRWYRSDRYRGRAGPQAAQRPTAARFPVVDSATTEPSPKQLHFIGDPFSKYQERFSSVGIVHYPAFLCFVRECEALRAVDFRCAAARLGAALPPSAWTLFRKASIKFTTLVGFSTFAGVIFLPVCFFFSRSFRASS